MLVDRQVKQPDGVTVTTLKVNTEDYLIVHTPFGTIDVNVEMRCIDLNSNATKSFMIVGYDSEMKKKALHRP